MAMSTNERVDTLENALKELAYAGRRTEMSLDRLSEETRASRAEMGTFKAESEAFHAEMSIFKEEMKLAHEEHRRDFRDAQRKWGELANKMGTLVEDMVVPSFPGVLRRYFSVEEVEDQLVRRVKRHPEDRSREKEFDIIAWTADTVFVNETKSAPKDDSFDPFIEGRDSIFEYFPELAGKKLVKIAAALWLTPRLISHLSSGGCYAMMLGDEMMDLVNFEEVSKTRDR